MKYESCIIIIGWPFPKDSNTINYALDSCDITLDIRMSHMVIVEYTENILNALEFVNNRINNINPCVLHIRKCLPVYEHIRRFRVASRFLHVCPYELKKIIMMKRNCDINDEKVFSPMRRIWKNRRPRSALVAKTCPDVPIPMTTIDAAIVTTSANTNMWIKTFAPNMLRKFQDSFFLTASEQFKIMNEFHTKPHKLSNNLD